MLVVDDLVQETTSTQGTGAITLAGAVVGCQSFASIGDGNTTYYRIVNGNNSEIGVGTYTASNNTLSRDTVERSIISGVAGQSKINLTSTSIVMCVMPAKKTVIDAATLLNIGGARFLDLKNQGFSLIGTNPNITSNTIPSQTSAGNITAKVLHTAVSDCNEIALLYNNFTVIQPSQSFQGNYNPILVGGSLQAKGALGYTDDTGEIVPLSFKNGKRKTHIDAGGIAITEPEFFPLKANQEFYTRSYLGFNLPPSPLPPVLTAQSTGGTLPANNTFYACIVLVYADGLESMTSQAASVTTSATTTNAVLVTSPFSVVSGTATSGSSNTLVLSSASWTTNQYQYMTVTIASGTGAGQSLVIASNTSTTLTTTSNWTTNPDSTSVFNIIDPKLAGAAIGYKVLSVGGSSGTATSLFYAASVTPIAGGGGIPCDVIDFGINTTIYSYPSTNNNDNFYRAGGFRSGIGGIGSNGGTIYNGLNSGEGYSTGDQTNNNKGILTQARSSTIYSPLAILGKPTTYIKTVGLIGDSIQAGTGDSGYTYAAGGHGARAVCAQFSNTFRFGMGLASALLVSGGSGYAVNDTITLAGGTFTTAAVLKIASVASGVITGFSVLSSGEYTAWPTTFTQGATSGGGTSATFNAPTSNNLYPPSYAYTRIPLGGEQAFQFANQLNTNQFNRNRILPSIFATNVISNYGTNDLGLGLASIQASLVTIANWYQQFGIKFIQLTILPKTNSTTYFKDLINQTPVSESVRIPLNNWLRNPTASGFVQATKNPSLAAVIDICAGFEVDSSNNYYTVDSNGAQSTNAGYWPIPQLSGLTWGSSVLSLASSSVTMSSTYTGSTINNAVITFGTSKVTTGTVTNGSSTISSMASVTNIVAGQLVTASIAGIPVLCTVSSVGANSVVLSGNFTGTTTAGVTLTFSNKPVTGTLTNGSNIISNISNTFNIVAGQQIYAAPQGAFFGSATSGTTASVTDTSKSWNTNDYKGWSLSILSGNAANSGSTIFYNTSNQITISNTMAVSPSATDIYQVSYIPTIDGIHPSTWSHIKLAQIIASQITNTLI